MEVLTKQESCIFNPGFRHRKRRGPGHDIGKEEDQTLILFHKFLFKSFPILCGFEMLSQVHIRWLHKLILLLKLFPNSLLVLREEKRGIISVIPGLVGLYR